MALKKKNKIGSSFDQYLTERGILRECEERAIKQILTDHLLLEGLNSGQPIPVDDKFWSDLKQEALAKLEARKRKTV